MKLINCLNDDKKLKEHLVKRLKEAEKAEVKLERITFHKNKTSK